MLNMSKLFFLIATLSVFNVPYALSGNVYNITDYGAKGDSVTINTVFIQKAVDDCSLNGGGTVFFPAGIYQSGTICLKDDVHLYLDRGAILLCSTDTSAFPLHKSPMVALRTNMYSLIYAERKKNITISGEGTIIGQGDKPPYHIAHSNQHLSVVRPKIICMVQCENIRVKGITLRNSPSWMQHYLGCSDLFIDGLTVRNRRSSVNNDGIDIDCCKNVCISNCNIDSEDDCIVMKSTSWQMCENITISNCILSSHCNALKCGTETNGGFQNITISNCVIFDTYLSGIALEIVDGGTMNLININNITMNKVNNPLFIKLGNRARPYCKDIVPNIGEMKNIQVTNIQADNVGDFTEEPDLEFSHHNARFKAAAVFIDGLPEKNIGNIVLENFFIGYAGGGTKEDGLSKVPQNPQAYPEYSSYGDVRPSYGFFCRDIEGLRMRNIQVTFEKQDDRPAYQFEAVKQLFMEQVSGDISDVGQPLMRLVQCGDVYLDKGGVAVKKKNIEKDRDTKLHVR